MADQLTRNINTVTNMQIIDSNDSILISDDQTVLKKINYNLLAKAIVEQYKGSKLLGYNQSISDALNIGAGAGWHNSVCRGKNITSYLNDNSLWDRIKGTNGYELFEDLYLGDYIVYGDNSYSIVDFDYYFNVGYALASRLTEHHIVMMPTLYMIIPEGTPLYGIPNATLTYVSDPNPSRAETNYKFKWGYATNDPTQSSTAGGYKYSRMRRVIMKAAETLVIGAFGESHVKPINVMYPNPSSPNDDVTTQAFPALHYEDDDRSSFTCKSICDLPNEVQIYGYLVNTLPINHLYRFREVGNDHSQFSLCRFKRDFVNISWYYWLRGVYDATHVVLHSATGRVGAAGTSDAYCIRPRFVLVG